MTGGGTDAGDRAESRFAQHSDSELCDTAAAFPLRQWKPPPEMALGRVRRLARFIPLVEAWCSPGPGRAALTVAERDLLAVVHFSVRQGSGLLIRIPGGLHRLPLLAAVMIAADSLDVPEAELADVSGNAPPPGPVALVSARMVRRRELDVLDASSVRVAPALHPHRLRGDGLMSPVRGGRPRLVTGAARLLFVAPVTGFPGVLGVAPRAVVIDAAAETDCVWLPLAKDWAQAHGSIVITVADLHHAVEPLGSGGVSPRHDDSGGTERPSAATPGGCRENVWIADWPWLRRTVTSLAAGTEPPPGSPVQQVLAESRGRAHLLAVEDRSRSDLAEVRERLARLRDPRGGDSPWPVRKAARLTRLLIELPTSAADYDRIAPRYGGRTLRRLLDDILDADARNDFPASWRARVAAEWGAVRAGLTAAYEALSARNPLMEVISDLIEDAYRQHRELDIVCGSRSARDALAGRLASSGTLRIEDSPLVTIRSISTTDAAGAHRTTLLIGPPAGRWRHRLTAADLGQLIVIGASADLSQLYHALRNVFGEPSREAALATRRTALTALTGVAAGDHELDGTDLQIGVTTEKADCGRSGSRISLPDPEALIRAALTEPPDGPDSDLSGLEAEPDGMQESPEPATYANDRQVGAVPLVVRSTALEETNPPAAVLVAASTRVQRLRGDEIRLLPVTGVAAGMILIGISEPERRTLFDRIRPLLADQQPQAAGLLLQLWRIALDDARATSGSVMELTERLSARGADITTQAVARWSDPARIGPIDPANVARIGKIAGSGVVAGEARRIAAVMREVRVRHAMIGSALVKLAGWHASGDYAALDKAADNLGPEITDLAADLTAWRVIAVGDLVLAPVSALRRPMPVEDAQRISRPALGPSTADAADLAEAGFLSIKPAPDSEES